MNELIPNLFFPYYSLPSFCHLPRKKEYSVGLRLEHASESLGGFVKHIAGPHSEFLI